MTIVMPFGDRSCLLRKQERRRKGQHRSENVGGYTQKEEHRCGLHIWAVTTECKGGVGKSECK